MSELPDLLTGGDPVTLKASLLSLLLAFALTQAIGVVYTWTFKGMSYSRSFVQAVAMGSIVACMLMLAINNSVAAGLGIAGSLAIIRFRTSMRDPRDMVFVFASMGAGIAAGLKAYPAAVLGTAIFCLAAVLLSVSEFGSQRISDGLLRFQVPTGADVEAELARILKRNTRHFALVTLREVAQGQAFEHAYQIQIPDHGRRVTLVRELEQLAGVQGVALLLQEPTVEL